MLERHKTLESEREELLIRIAEFLCSCDWDSAYETILEALDEQPDSGAAWELRALLESYLGNQHAAVASMEHASLLIPLQPLASRCLALDYVAIGKTELGVELLISLAQIHQNPIFVRRISNDLLRLDQSAAALNVLAYALDLSDSAILWHELSTTLMHLGRPSFKALDAARRAISLSPSVASYRVTAARLLIGMDRTEDAFQIVRPISSSSLKKLECSCCLWRLIHIYNAFDCPSRVQNCYQRLRSLSEQTECL
ncbi:MAG: hypothetical protein AAF483_13415 [Planctomycetota bacterium]